MKRRRDTLVALGFILPAVIIYLFYFILPIPTSLYYSLFRWNGVSSNMKFLGFGNWSALFRDPIFWRSLLNNMFLVAGSIAIQLPIGLLLAVLISSSFKGARLLKLLYFVPMMISSVAIGLTWNFIYEPNFGLLNALLTAIGLERFALGWLGDPKLALWSVVVTICWQYIPYYMMIFAAALAGIPKELYEAAYIDGASKPRAFFGITLPLLKNTIRVTCVLSLTGSLRYFDLLYVMTGGGPDHASELLATYMFSQAFTGFRMGYGSTVAIFMFIISLGLAVLVLSRNLRESTTRA